MIMERVFGISFFVVLLLTIRLEAVSVNPSLCPTNKIAPHKRIANWEHSMGRTFGAFYDLLTPGNGNPPYDAPNYQNDLQEQPQEDDPTDCGEIEDYDDNDLSSIDTDYPLGSVDRGLTTRGLTRRSWVRFLSRTNNCAGNTVICSVSTILQRPAKEALMDERVNKGIAEAHILTPQGNRRQGDRNSRGFDIKSFFLPFNNYPTRPPNYPERPPNRPQRPEPQRPPSYPQRPPSYPERPPNYPERPPNYPQRPPNYTSRPPSYPQRPPNQSQGPYPETKPPYWCGGFFCLNEYRPPQPQSPSDTVKPVYERPEDNRVTYRPNLVGGPLGHIVGASPAVPTRQDESTTIRTFYDRFTTSTPYISSTRSPRARNLNSGVFESFVDLLFK